MNNELLNVSDFVSILEIFLTLIVAFVGAAVHEYVFTPGKTNLIHNAHVWATVAVDFILCYSINPYIVSLNPRLILLPPLIIGLLGNELAIRMGTIKGSITMIEYILSWFHIKRHKDDDKESDEFVDEPGKVYEEGKKYGDKKPEPPTQPESKEDPNKPNTIENKPTVKEDKQEEPVKEQPKHKIGNINNLVHFTLNNISDTLIEYYSTEDSKFFLESYYDMKLKIQNIVACISKQESVPIATAIKYAEILKKEIELDNIYNKITQTKRKD